MLIKFSLHALERIKERNLSMDKIQMTIKNPDNEIFDSNDIIIAQKKFDNYLYRVFLKNEKIIVGKVKDEEIKDQKLIITVYKTSKIDKYQ